MDDNDNPQRTLRPETPVHPPAPNGFPLRPRPQVPLEGRSSHGGTRPLGRPVDAASAPSSVAPAQQTAPSSSLTISRGEGKKKRLLLWGLISLAIVLLGLMLAYIYWYQNPSKMVSDALLNTLNAKSLTYTGTVARTGSTKVDVGIDGGASADGATVNAKFGFDVRGKKYNFEGNALTNDKSDLYFKVKNIDDLVSNYRSAIPEQSHALFDQIIAKVDDKWIKVSATDVKNYNADLAKAQKCTVEAVKKLQSDSATKAELETAYKDHPFIVIDKNLGSKGGSTGYTLKTNPNETKGFTEAYKSTGLYSTLKNCDPGFVVKGDDMFGGKAASFNVWIDRWTHRVTTLEIMRGTTTIALHPTFNTAVNIATPKNSTTLEQLQKDVQSLVQSAQKPAAQP